MSTSPEWLPSSACSAREASWSSWHTGPKSGERSIGGQVLACDARRRSGASAGTRRDSLSGTTGSVKFRGGVSIADRAREYEECTIFVLPSSQEGFGLVFLEAMAHEKPVVACDAGGAPEVVAAGECGLLVPPGNLLGLYEAIRTLLLDPDLRRRFGVAGKRRVQELFTTERFKERVRSLLAGQAEGLA